MGQLLNIIKEDLYRHRGLQGFSGFVRGWYKPGFRYTLLFRLVCAQKSSPLRLILKLLKRRYRIRYGYEINLEAEIGMGFYLSDHIGSVVIGPVKIGKYCNIAHNVTIGRAYKNGKIGRPVIGDRVWIGTGSVIVGGINIGSNVFIAPNTLLSTDVPDNSFVVGNPARIISRDNPTDTYITYIRSENQH
jgi:serine O-acetyltransferase